MTHKLVLCGGTGAHVGAAYLRLHVLGSPFRLFSGQGSHAVPQVFLVDQDAGDLPAASTATAWGACKRLLHHLAVPAKEMSPLPVSLLTGVEPTLRTRFREGAALQLAAASHQQDIEYTKGMICSPPLGALLFELKCSEGHENDAVFRELAQSNGETRTAVVGSGVGGTGAAVGPALARYLMTQGHRTMACMVLRWFRLSGSEPKELAESRNEQMKRNQSAALHYYQRDLARDIAVVPLGVPEEKLALRHYSGDLQQCEQTHAVHAAAAIAIAHHLMADRPLDAGAHLIGTNATHDLDPGSAVPGGTLGEIAILAATLIDLLKVWNAVLTTKQQPQARPAIYEDVLRAVESEGDLAAVGQALLVECNLLEEQLSWLFSVCPRLSQVEGLAGLTFEGRSRARLATHPLTSHERAASQVALTLVRWTARWILDEARKKPRAKREMAAAFLLPDARGAGSKRPGVRVACGELQRADANLAQVFDGLAPLDEVDVSSWPHPLASTSHFRWALERERPRERRQLSLLVVGLAMGHLKLRRSAWAGSARSGSPEQIFERYRSHPDEAERLPSLSDFVLVFASPQKRGEVVMGCSAPDTLFVPVPCDDRRIAERDDWDKLCQFLVDGNGDPWRGRPLRWRPPVARIAAAIKRSVPSGRDAPSWATELHKELPDEPAAEGLSELSGNGAALVVRLVRQGELGRFFVHTGDHLEGEPDRDAKASVTRHTARQLENLFPQLSVSPGGYSVVHDFDVPVDFPADPREVKSTRSGIWLEHLRELLVSGAIRGFTQSGGELILHRQQNDVVRTDIFADCEILILKDMVVASVVPLRQTLPAALEPREALLPVSPLKSRYLGLLASAEGGARPPQKPDNRRTHAAWSLQMLGRRHPVALTRPFDAPGEANWMVWPSFRTLDNSQRPSTNKGHWKVYFFYSHVEQTSEVAEVSVVWRSPAGLVKQHADKRVIPIGFRNNQFDGGPPEWIVPSKDGQEFGAYAVALRSLSPADTHSVDVAIDFGTANSAAAYQSRGEPSRAIAFGKPPGAPQDRLTHHVSWFQSDCETIEKLGYWLPTFARASETLPSELLIEMRALHRKSQDTWIPGEVFTIPANSYTPHADTQVPPLRGFKWSDGNPETAQYRLHYLRMFVWLTMASILDSETHRSPAVARVTFTYPLRSTPNEKKQFEQATVDVLRESEILLGLVLQPSGLIDESRAAKNDDGLSGEILLVADLGGGTLDLMISASGDQRGRTLVDSVRLGGDRLLGHLVNKRSKMLPEWGVDAQVAETVLRAWLRNDGARSLFGGGKHSFSGRDNFPSKAAGEPARAFIAGYFSLVEEYIARSLVAYLYDVRPAARRIGVQLRGNGWRLQEAYSPLDARDRATRVQAKIGKRVAELWKTLPTGTVAPASDEWLDPSHYVVSNPKTFAAENAVRLSQQGKPDGVDREYILVDLTATSQDPVPVVHTLPWYAPMPFATAPNAKIEFRALSPKVSWITRQLPPDTVKDVNRGLTLNIGGQYQERSVDIRRTVFERLFTTAEFATEVRLEAPAERGDGTTAAQARPEDG